MGTHRYTYPLPRDDVCVEWRSGIQVAGGSFDLSTGCPAGYVVPVHLLLSFLTERIPPAARPIPSGGGGAGFSPFLASVQLPLFILLPPREWKN